MLDRVDAMNLHAADGTHMFPLSQVYEGLLLKMGDKGNDGVQFFTRAKSSASSSRDRPAPGETIYDPGCGTGGFLAESFEQMTAAGYRHTPRPSSSKTLQARTFFGREKENLVYPIALANLVLHGIDRAPHLARQHADRPGAPTMTCSRMRPRCST